MQKSRRDGKFSELLDGEVMEDSRSRGREYSEMRLDPRMCGHITKDEIKEALKKMIRGKAEGPNQISWKYGSVWVKKA